MFILITFFATLAACTVLLVVYLSDLWEREPIEAIQNAFVVGLGGQLVLALAATFVASPQRWDGVWTVATAGLAAVLAVAVTRQNSEVDEAFDHVVYAVAVFTGAVTVVHVYNQPVAIAESPYRDLASPVAIPDLRDLWLVVSSSGLPRSLGEELVILLAGVAAGIAVALAGRRKARPGVQLVAAAGSAMLVVSLDGIADGAWPLRVVTGGLVLAWAVRLKRSSVHRRRPDAMDEGVVRDAAKTVLMVLGAVLLTVVALATLGNREGLLDSPAADGLHVPERPAAVRPAER